MAFWVMIYHTKEAVEIPILSFIVNNGFLGVDVFFVLSGYILTHVYHKKFFENSSTSRDLFKFWKRRFARVYPLHIFTLILAVIYINLLDKYTNANISFYYDHIIPQVLLIHGWGVVDGLRWNFPSWSVSSEWFAYLFVFPVCFYSYRKINMPTFFTRLTILLLSFCLVVNSYFHNNVGEVLEWGIIRIIPEFMLGSFAYLLFWSEVNGKRVYLLVYLIIALTITITFANYQYLFILSLPFLLLGLHVGNSFFDKIFGNRWVVFLGEISYSIYMIHFFSRSINGIIYSKLFEVEVNSPVYFINYFIITIVLSFISYKFIEVPGMKWVRSK